MTEFVPNRRLRRRIQKRKVAERQRKIVTSFECIGIKQSPGAVFLRMFHGPDNTQLVAEAMFDEAHLKQFCDALNEAAQHKKKSVLIHGLERLGL